MKLHSFGRHACLTCAEGVQLYCPSSTYPAIPYWDTSCCTITSKAKSAFQDIFFFTPHATSPLGAAPSDFFKMLILNSEANSLVFLNYIIFKLSLPHCVLLGQFSFIKLSITTNKESFLFLFFKPFVMIFLLVMLVFQLLFKLTS